MTAIVSLAYGGCHIHASQTTEIHPGLDDGSISNTSAALWVFYNAYGSRDNLANHGR